MSISRKILIVKNVLKSNHIGKKVRDIWQMRGFTKANAERTFDLFMREQGGMFVLLIKMK